MIEDDRSMSGPMEKHRIPHRLKSGEALTRIRSERQLSTRQNGDMEAQCVYQQTHHCCCLFLFVCLFVLGKAAAHLCRLTFSSSFTLQAPHTCTKSRQDERLDLREKNTKKDPVLKLNENTPLLFVSFLR